MQLWDKILQLALLGSERTHLDPAVKEALRHYNIDLEDPMPKIVLSAAATLRQLRKLEMPVKPIEIKLPEPALDEEEQEAASNNTLLHLKQILSGRYRRALPEFIRLLQRKGQGLPPAYLPELLDSCLQDQALWQAIQPLLGERARWLITQNTDWQMLMPQGDPDRWENAGPEERKQILGGVRNNTPAKAISLLQNIWQEISFKQKLDFLSLLEKGLSPADESFLESCLQDSRKEVRFKAADLLAHLPESRLVKRLFQFVRPLLKYTPTKKRLEVKLPEEIPEESLKDGIRLKVGKGKDSGLKLKWLETCIARIPPSCWVAYFGVDLEQVIRLFGGSNRSDTLITALGEASLRFKDVPLAVQLIRFLMLKNGSFPEGLRWQALARQVPAVDLQEMALAYFQQQAGLLTEQHLLTKILELGIHPWDTALAREIIRGLKQWMAESKTFLWNIWHYKKLLEAAGYCAPVELFDSFNADWPIRSPVWNQWAPDVERMLRIMRFRIEMRG